MKSFSKFVEGGLSLREIEAIDSIRTIIFNYLRGLAGVVAAKPFGWKLFGKQSENSESFDFYPSLFVHCLKVQLKELEYRLQYMEMMTYSQLFVEFVDEQRKSSLAK